MKCNFKFSYSEKEGPLIFIYKHTEVFSSIPDVVRKRAILGLVEDVSFNLMQDSLSLSLVTRSLSISPREKIMDTKNNWFA